MLTASPKLVFVHTTKAFSNSKSIRLEDPNKGLSAHVGIVCPLGLLIGVPLTTIEDAMP